MTLRDPQGNFIGSPLLGETTYEYDWFCMAADTCILAKRPNGAIQLCYMRELSENDRVLSVNKTGAQEWRSIKITRNIPPDNLVQLRAGSLVRTTNNHKLFRPGFEIEAAGNLRLGDRLMTVSMLDLPESRTELTLSDEIQIPDWLLVSGDQIGHRGKSPKNFDRYIPDIIALDRNFGLLVGLYLAEGSLSKNAIQYAFHQEEEELSDLVCHALTKVFGESGQVDVIPKYSRRCVHIFHKTLWYVYSELLPGNCYVKEVPSWCFDAPYEFKLGLLQGWIFGDGGKGDRNIRGTSASQKLICGMHNIALSLGIASTISKEKDVYRLHISSRENFERLFPAPVRWKHYKAIRDYLDVANTQKAYTERQLSELFVSHYQPGMTKQEFCRACGLSPEPFIRVFGSWYSLLKSHGYGPSAKRQYVTKVELLTQGWRWLQNNEFSESKWMSDDTLPSIGWIRKYFGKSSKFVRCVKALSREDVLKMESPPTEAGHIASRNITEISYAPCHDEYVYDIAVEGNGNFIVGNIISHNSGSQINVMFGDTVIDTCVGIGFNAEQSKTPVYGWANQYYTFVADAKVLVTGSLTIAFKEAGYLFWPIKKFLYQKANTKTTSPRYALDSDNFLVRNAQEYVTLGGAAKGAENRRVMKANVEQMMEWQYGPTKVGSQYNRFWQELGHMEDNLFEDWAEVFEDVIWYGSDPSNPLLRDRLFSNNLKTEQFAAGDDITDSLIYSHRRADQYPPIDVWITYGDMDRQAVNHTVRKIMDLSFIGQAQTIEVSGEPTYEVYHFIARNVV
jgi:intein/homing endonuclease